MGRIAVVGAGVAGLVSAYYLSKDHHVDLFESESRIGGHTHTVIVPQADLPGLPVDTGFIVFNEANYPNFLKFISELGVEYQPSDMSFSYTSRNQDFFWGSDFPRGIFAQRRHLISPSYYQFLFGVHRFNQQCLDDYEIGIPETFTLGHYLEYRDISRAVVTQYILPMTSAIWSGSFEDSLKFPVNSFIRFWKNHQLLEIGKGLPWKTIVGGSHSYIQKVLPQISGDLFKARPVQSIRLSDRGVDLNTAMGHCHYDAVVVATHADTALRMLADPTVLQVHALTPWRYSTNRTTLHTDPSVMPPVQSAWCSWNVRQSDGNELESPVSVSYWMNRLQSLNTQQNYFVTLNDPGTIQSNHIVRDMAYTHPIMSAEAIKTQSVLPELNHASRIVFCGSYFGYGFHEDAVSAAINAVDALTHTMRSSGDRH